MRRNILLIIAQRLGCPSRTSSFRNFPQIVIADALDLIDYLAEAAAIINIGPLESDRVKRAKRGGETIAIACVSLGLVAARFVACEESCIDDIKGISTRSNVSRTAKNREQLVFLSLCLSVYFTFFLALGFLSCFSACR